MFKLTNKEFKEIIATLSKGDTKGSGNLLQIISDGNSIEFIAGLNPQIRKTISVPSEPGNISVDFSEFKKIASKLKSDVSFDLTDTLKVTSGKITLHINGLDRVYTNHSFENLFTVNTSDLIGALKTVLHSVSSQESRPVLTAVNMAVKNELVLTSTDSYRLSRNNAPLLNVNKEDATINPSGASLKKFVTIKNLSENVTFSISENHDFIEIDDTNGLRMILENIGGNYPDTDRLLNVTSNTLLDLSIPDILEGLDVIEMIVKNEKIQSKMAIFELENTNRLVAKNSAGITSEIELPAHSGENLSIAFNPSYLKDALQTFDKNDTVKMIFSSPLRPFLIENDSNIQLITPIRRNN